MERVDRDRRYTRHWLLYTKARAAIFQDKKIGRFEIDRRKYKDRNVDTGDERGGPVEAVKPALQLLDVFVTIEVKPKFAKPKQNTKINIK